MNIMRTINRILALLCSAFLLFACESGIDEGGRKAFLVGTPSSLVFDRTGEETKSVTITSNHPDWTYAYGDVQWLEVMKDGNRLLITAKPNKGSDERTATIEISIRGHKVSKSVNVLQFGSSPVIKVSLSEQVFDNKGDTRSVEVITNTGDWTISKVEDNTDWLTFEKLSGERNAVILKVAALPKEDDNYKENRKATLILSNGASHAQLNVTQTGWVLFGDFFLNKKSGRKEIEKWELEKGHVRDNEYENRFWREKPEDDVVVMAFKTGALQSTRTVYRFDWETMNILETVILKAEQNKTFDEDDMNRWMLSKKFKKGDSGVPTEFKYYYDDGERTTFAKVCNEANCKFNGYDIPGAYMEFNYVSNSIEFNESKRMANFPVRNFSKLHDKNFQLQQVIEYEAKYGLKLDNTHPQTKKRGDDPNLYEVAVFTPVNKSPNPQPGDLEMVVYWFNFPDLKDEQGGIPDDLSVEPELAGTVGMRADAYYGNDYAYIATEHWYLGKQYRIRNTVLYNARNIGFTVVNTDNTTGMAGFVRGEDELAIAEPSLEHSIFRFFKSKKLVDYYRSLGRP